jgi:hypothetical protein
MELGAGLNSATKGQKIQKTEKIFLPKMFGYTS